MHLHGQHFWEFSLLYFWQRCLPPRYTPLFSWFTFENLDESPLQRAIRNQGKPAEYAPIFLLILYFAKASKFEPTTIDLYRSIFFWSLNTL